MINLFKDKFTLMKSSNEEILFYIFLNYNDILKDNEEQVAAD